MEVNTDALNFSKPQTYKTFFCLFCFRYFCLYGGASTRVKLL